MCMAASGPGVINLIEALRLSLLWQPASSLRLARWRPLPKPLVLNKTNYLILAQSFGPKADCRPEQSRSAIAAEPIVLECELPKLVSPGQQRSPHRRGGHGAQADALRHGPDGQ